MSERRETKVEPFHLPALFLEPEVQQKFYTAANLFGHLSLPHLSMSSFGVNIFLIT